MGSNSAFTESTRDRSEGNQTGFLQNNHRSVMTKQRGICSQIWSWWIGPSCITRKCCLEDTATDSDFHDGSSTGAVRGDHIPSRDEGEKTEWDDLDEEFTDAVIHNSQQVMKKQSVSIDILHNANSWVRLPKDELDKILARGENPHRTDHRHSFVVHSGSTKMTRRFPILTRNYSATVEKLNFPGPAIGSKPSSLDVRPDILTMKDKQTGKKFQDLLDNASLVQELRIDHRHRKRNLKYKRERSVSTTSQLRQTSNAELLKLEEYWRSTIQDWSKSVRNPDVRKVWGTYGIPRNLRRFVWPLAIGNAKKVTKEDFDKYKPLYAMSDPPDERDVLEEQIPGRKRCKSISNDLSRMFGKENLMTRERQFLANLSQVLLAYCNYNPKGSYVQGMSYLVSMLLSYMDCESAFICFVNLIESKFLNQFIEMDLQSLHDRFKRFDCMFTKALPLLCSHFKRNGIPVESYLMPWILTMYTQPLPFPVASRIWDAYLNEGEIVLLKAAVAILALHRNALITKNTREIFKYLTDLPDDISEEKFMSVVMNVDSGRRHKRPRKKLKQKSKRTVRKTVTISKLKPKPQTIEERILNSKTGNGTELERHVDVNSQAESLNATQKQRDLAPSPKSQLSGTSTPREVKRGDWDSEMQFELEI